FTALGAALFLAVHPVRAGRAGGATADSGGSRACSGGGTSGARGAPGGFFGLFRGAEGGATADGETSRHLAALRAAGSADAACEALDALGHDGDDAAVAAIAARATEKQREALRVRECAVSALGMAKAAAARSWLEELTSDRIVEVRDAALAALAQRDDPE